jgi:crotonobetainyl-CoA:carnitine CoA-transferase CaiB-like acyl-CoA transferase
VASTLESDARNGALAGLRVLELSDESGMYCGKLLADLGADVLRIEAPGGDRVRSNPPLWSGDGSHSADPPAQRCGLRFRYLNTSKRSLALDLEAPEGRGRFIELARGADLVIECLAPGRLSGLGLGFETLRAENPGLIMTSITGFGQTGPHRDFSSSDLVINAMGGAVYVTGDPADPPVNLAGDQAFMMASTCAAASSLIALRHRNATGAGQHIDISAQEVVLAVTHISGVGKYLDDGIVPVRNGTSLFAAVPSGAYRCKDGLIYLIVNRPRHWQALAQWIHEETGNLEVIDPMFEGPSSARIEYRELLDIFISDMTCKFSVEELYHEGQRRHIAMTPVNSYAEVVKDPHLTARAFFVDVPQADRGTLIMPGAPYRLSETPWRVSGGSPDLPAPQVPNFPERARDAIVGGNTEQQALAGVRVLEFTAGMAGPWIGRYMAYCGAEVIKVETVRHLGVVRLYIPPRARELGVQPALSPWFTDWDAGKQFVSLDLTNPDAAKLAMRLVARADVVIENNSTGVMDKLGLGYDAMAKEKPDLIHLSTTGYGETGPCAKYVTWGPNIEALSGLSRLSGYPGRECINTQYAYPDAVGALHGLVAVMAALDHRDRTGVGQHIALSQLEATIACLGAAMIEPLATGVEPERPGNRSLYLAPQGCYPCSGEDRWCAISVKDDDQWRAFCTLLGHLEWSSDSRFSSLEQRLANADALDVLIGEWTHTRDAHDVMNELQAAGIAAGVAVTVEDMLERDPHLAARGYFETIPHLVKGTVVATGIPLGLTQPPGKTTRAGAGIGCDNDFVFGELLGLSPAELLAHRESGAIETP